jgi:hypothetical protein
MSETKRTPAIAAELSMTSTGDAITLTFANGKTLSLEEHSISPDIKRYAMLHGLKQKLVDAAAMSCGPDGKPATVDDKYNAVREVYDRLLSGDWNKEREGGATGGLLLRALMEMFDKDRDTVLAFLTKKTDKEQSALRRNPKVAAIILRLSAEKAGAGAIDSDAILEELVSE